MTFSYVGLAANGANNEVGDYVYRSEQIVSPFRTTDISESTAVGKMFYFQNPVHDQLRINYIVENAGKVEISLFSLDGKLVKTITNKNQGARVYSENMNDLTTYPRGLYMLQGILNGKAISEKIVLE